MENRPRVRFAPSPTGDLHIGNARTAFFNWLFARRHNGSFVLRIEDTDQERTSKLYERRLIDDLKWLSLDWDEGPEKGGAFGPYHQIERVEIYKDFLDKLAADGKVYQCYCTEDELDAQRRKLLSMRITPRYSGRCRDLDALSKKKLEDEGRKPALRFRVEHGLIEFNDIIRGAMTFEAESIGDFIVVRSNGIPSYNFAVVIDDHLMKITHVIRGEDHLSNTAIQILVYKALGFDPPLFAHHSLILGLDRAKLSKRHGSVSVRSFREQGFLNEALLNYMALGGFAGEEREIASLKEIVDAFSLERISKSGAVFDEAKLKWLNSAYIRNSNIEKLMVQLAPFMKEAGFDPDTVEHDRLYRITAALKNNLVTLADIKDYIGIFVDDLFEMTQDAALILKQDSARKVISALRTAINEISSSDVSIYEKFIDRIRKDTGLEGKKLFMPIRAALTGKTMGPELDNVFAILGREAVFRRIERAFKMT